MSRQSPIRIAKPWGYELLYARTAGYAGKILHITRGGRLSRQYHESKEETIYVFAGRMELEIGEGGSMQRLVLGPGEGYHLAPGTIHRMIGLEDTDVLEVSSPELDDVIRLQDDYGRA